MHEPSDKLLERCVSVDIEVDPKTARIFAFAAIQRGEIPPILSRKGDLEGALDRLERSLANSDHLIGHNILRHDLPHLAAERPRLAELFGAPIDTLWLNPLAFPRNPYHHLVKHYHDGRLQAGHVNNPELDARLVFQVLENQINAFRDLHRAEPDALTAYHFLATRQEASAGFDAVFSLVRSAPVPSARAAEDAIRRLLSCRACGRRIEQTLGRLASPQLGWPMAYALSWISVAGGESVMPPWVRMQFREAALIVRHLRDTRGEQRGLLLLTAHRAKGLEFDYVVILDGGWEQPSRGEDADAPRRLFYVAVTRARRSLAVMATGAHPFLKPQQDAVLERPVVPDPAGLAGRPPHYVTPDLKLVDLSWAGRLNDGHPALAAINAAQVGDPVTLVADGTAWSIRNEKGQTLGRMARAYNAPEGLEFLRGEIGAIVRWRKSDNKEEFRSTIRRDEWEAILPELVFG